MNIKDFIAILAMILIAVGYYSTKKSNSSTEFLILNIEALTQDENGDERRRQDCFDKGGNWNESSRLLDAGFYENVKCSINGEITIFGVTVKGSYTSGKTYNIPWAKYRCEPSQGNCCLKQGLYTGDTKLA